jgi:hypothetical protein
MGLISTPLTSKRCLPSFYIASLVNWFTMAAIDHGKIILRFSEWSHLM